MADETAKESGPENPADERFDLSALARLREAFPADQIDKLPRGIKKDQPKAPCNVCHGYHEPASLHLDYVGHARVTQRLLDADPTWTWEPLAWDAEGQPALMRDPKGVPIGLWIRLTAGGLSRLGFGEVPATKGADGIKEGIGDAIRNAAMRFGVALDLWMKEAPEDRSSSRAPSSRQAKGKKPEKTPPPISTEQIEEINKLIWDSDGAYTVEKICEAWKVDKLEDLTAERAVATIARLKGETAEKAPA